MLELVNGRNSQSISGLDRPAILEGISGVMERPEWRLPPSPFSPLSDRVTQSQAAHQTTTFLQQSNSFDFVVESVHHNVRNAFVQNLFSQMVYVVDRMSMKHAPASLVSFCGKSCAYAFFFCPGIADVLVRLWDIKPTQLRQIVRANELEINVNYTHIAESVASNYPQYVQGLCFKTLRTMITFLKKNPVLPLGVDKIQWRGHWLGRWSGKDTDLFYAFVKSFHLLSIDFLPPNASEKEKACAPGMALVQTQMLANMMSTIQRQSPPAAPDISGDASVTFDDLLAADGNASNFTVSGPSANATRLMADNRMILLLREFLSRKSTLVPASCFLFAWSFGNSLQATAKSTPVEPEPAQTLCDFLQEVFPILVPFQVLISIDEKYLDEGFWVDAFKKITLNHHSNAEMRLYAFLFSIWSNINSSEAWKNPMCFGFLLEEDHFLRTFNHWCPMVRAYFMRLVCWRLARYDGSASDSDL